MKVINHLEFIYIGEKNSYFAFRNGSCQTGEIWLYSGCSYIASWSNYSWWNQWYYYIVYRILYGRKEKKEKLNEWILFVAEVTVPVALLGAEIDKYFPVEEFNQIGNILSAKPGVSSLYINTCFGTNIPLLKGRLSSWIQFFSIWLKFVEFGRLIAWWRFFQVLTMVGHWGTILMMNLLLSLQKKLTQTCWTG